ncbi:g-specific adenine glycosylase [Colletotrichum musicola]|uniref:Adenine DNA glycosylase n=1 Tax=Colletotrichum musicola TaxID=2175873 RepID=A0A8H6K7Y8_9PEZI|nr:g-specific adenine glycosylase [Colletotrichum musicola]
MQRLRRQSSLAAAKRILAQADDEPDLEEPTRQPPKPRTRRAARTPRQTDASETDFTPEDDGTKDEEEEEEDAIEIPDEPQPKRRKIEKATKTKTKTKATTTTAKATTRKPAASKSDNAKLHASLFGPGATVVSDPCLPPSRQHAIAYHRPLLLDRRAGRDALFAWFDSVSATRGMPWRKPWIDPASVADAAELRSRLERRAYEVWISEIMLQQTRVAVVVGYWERWMARWPTIRDLAAADRDDVLAAWRGLGYYSRATRIHEAARLIVADEGWDGLMPADVTELEARVPGVGRYTAGAVSAIVFGKAAPMVDGNVVRVLSRQIGIFGNVKTDKGVVDMLWAAADALVKAVARDFPDGEVKEEEGKEAPVSDRPGRWGQALMELGSTVCMPKPNCSACPITSTCRVYAEGIASAARSKKAVKVKDMEDMCSVCEPFESASDDDAAASDEDSDASTKKPAKGAKRGKSKPGPKQTTLSAFKFAPKTEGKEQEEGPDQRTLDVIVEHARRFPLKVAKKPVREEEALVCGIRNAGPDDEDVLLIVRRPEKGLLAGLWELPTLTLPEGVAHTKASRARDAAAYVEELLAGSGGGSRIMSRHGEVGSVPWQFSHLRLTMHVHLFDVSCPLDAVASRVPHRWATVDEIEDESMGTGMRKCWAMVKDKVEL